MKRLGLGLFALAAAGTACVSPTACDDYVDYVCECHADDPGYDCEELRLLYEDAEGAELADCQLAMQDQVAADEAAGDSCEVGGT